MKTDGKNKLYKRQLEILILLYRYRFLNRHHIQIMLNHKYRSRVITWLNKLVEEEYIVKYWSKQLAANPAVYSLSTKGRDYLIWAEDKRLDNEEINITLLDRVWRDKKLSKQFREHCLFVADIYLYLIALAKRDKSKLKFRTKTDAYGIDGVIKPGPDMLFSVKDTKGEIKRYFLDIFDDIPPAAIRKRVKDYLEYYDDDKWQDSTGKPFPEIILVCPNKRIKGHLYYFILKQRWDDDEPVFYLTTKEAVKYQGLNRKVLEKVEEQDY